MGCGSWQWVPWVEANPFRGSAFRAAVLWRVVSSRSVWEVALTWSLALAYASCSTQGKWARALCVIATVLSAVALTLVVLSHAMWCIRDDCLDKVVGKLWRRSSLFVLATALSWLAIFLRWTARRLDLRCASCLVEKACCETCRTGIRLRLTCALRDGLENILFIVAFSMATIQPFWFPKTIHVGVIAAYLAIFKSLRNAPTGEPHPWVGLTGALLMAFAATLALYGTRINASWSEFSSDVR